jgi:nicotinamide-nucleotide amidase
MRFCAGARSSLSASPKAYWHHRRAARRGGYGEAAAKALPHAVQVADRAREPLPNPFVPSAMNEDLNKLAAEVLARARDAKLPIAVAESCTAGLLAQILSDAEGAGVYFAGGFVTYTKAQKTAALDVPAALMREKTAVCPEVAQAMAEGALAHSAADVSAAITGVAGPEPDEDGNPVGCVCIAVARAGFAARHEEFHYGRLSRQAIRERAVRAALEHLRALLSSVPVAA